MQVYRYKSLISVLWIALYDCFLWPNLPCSSLNGLFYFKILPLIGSLLSPMAYFCQNSSQNICWSQFVLSILFLVSLFSLSKNAQVTFLTSNVFGGIIFLRGLFQQYLCHMIQQQQLLTLVIYIPFLCISCRKMFKSKNVVFVLIKGFMHLALGKLQSCNQDFLQHFLYISPLKNCSLYLILPSSTLIFLTGRPPGKQGWAKVINKPITIVIVKVIF